MKYRADILTDVILHTPRKCGSASLSIYFRHSLKTVDAIGDRVLVCSVRDPARRLLSIYRFATPLMKRPIWSSFPDFVDKLLAGELEHDPHTWPQSRGVTKTPDHLIRVENFQDDVAAVKHLFTFTQDELPHFNASANTGEDLLSQIEPEKLRFAWDYYADDFVLGNYGRPAS